MCEENRVESMLCSLQVSDCLLWYDYILVAEGGYIIVYQRDTLAKCAFRKLFDGVIIHGIRNARSKSQAENSGEFYVFGGRFFSKFTLEVDSMGGIESVKISFSKSSISTMGDWIMDMKYFPDGAKVVAVLAQNRVAIIDSTDHINVEYHGCDIRCITYCGSIIGTCMENLIIATGTVTNELLIWDGSNGSVLQKLVIHVGVLFSITYCPKQRMIVTTSDDRSSKGIRIMSPDQSEPFAPITANDWKTATLTVYMSLFGHYSRVWRSAILANRIVTIGEDGNICLWDCASGKMLARRASPTGDTLSCLCATDSYILLGSRNGTLSRIDLKTLIPITDGFTMPYDSKYGGVCCISIDRDKMVVTTDDALYMPADLSSGLFTYSHEYRLRDFHDYNVVTQTNGYLFTGNLYGQVASMAVTDQMIVWDCERSHQGQVRALHTFWHQNKLCVLSCGAYGVLKVSTFDVDQKSLVFWKKITLARDRCSQSTCCVSPAWNRLLVGERSGSIRLFSLDVTNATSGHAPLSTLPGVHGSHGVTDLQVFDGIIYSSGRDGRILQLCVEGDCLKVLRVFWCSTQMQWIAKIFQHEDYIIAAGFENTDYNLYVTQLNYIAASIPTGGGHRAWGAGIKDGKFYFGRLYKDRVLVDSVDLEMCMPKLAKKGLHSRKINCVSLLRQGEDEAIIVTGGEDNIVTISKVDDDGIHPLRYLFEHISSVKSIDHCDSTCGSKVMVTCGGRAQIVVWMVSESLVVKMLRKHYLYNPDKAKCKKPWKDGCTNNNTPSTRYTNVAVKRCQSSSSVFDRFLIAVTGSDAVIRIFSFLFDPTVIEGENSSGSTSLTSLELELSMRASEFCQMKCRFFSTDELLSADSSGFVKLWNGKDLQCEVQVHQSGVNAMDLSGNLVVTGGDDNSIHLFKVCSDARQFVKLCQVENAHATQVTAVRFVRPDTIVSTSIDQRVATWKIVDGSNGMNLENQHSMMTAVPDVSDCVQLTQGVLVVGHGIELLAA